VELTPGEIISLMGDFYGTWQELKNAPPEEITQLLDVMQKERKGDIDANAEFEKITKGRYTTLAKANVTHFAPKNKQEWKTLHQLALEKAREAGTKKNADAFQEALLIDAAGGHFLTDAFASGHLMDSQKVEAAIIGYLKDNPIHAENPEMQSVLAGLDAANLASKLALKNIHDRLNVEGFEVTNKKGMTWKTFGDNHLKNAQETQHLAALAVFLSRQQVYSAQKGESPNVDEVLDLVPDEASVARATEQALADIPEAVRSITGLVHRNIGMLKSIRPPWYLLGPTLPFIGQSVLGTISDPYRPRVLEDYERRKQKDPMEPYPVPPLIRFDF
jgi:hypothetical protein